MPSNLAETSPGAVAATPRPQWPAPDPIALAQLWADQFQHLATLGVAGAGGVLILLQAELIQSGSRWWLALGLFVLTAVFSMQGQVAVVDAATEGQLPEKKARALRVLAILCLGAAGGAAFATLL